MGLSRPAAVALAAVGILAGCSSDLGSSSRRREQRTIAARGEVPGTGVDPGVRLAAPITATAVAGASIPTLAGDVSVALLAFTTAARADDADGNGGRLDRSSPVSADSNSADDVFLAAVVNEEVLVNGNPQPTAFTQGLVTVFRDDRCMSCHSFHYPGGLREVGHEAKTQRGSNEGCTVCHKPDAVLDPGSARPSTILWEAPDATQTFNTPSNQDFRGKTDRQLYDLVRTKPSPRDHLLNDDKILWALRHARVPFKGSALGGTVPIDPNQWDEMVEAWAVDNAFQFSTDKALRDVVLVSQRANTAATGSGASTAPSVAFEPNPSYSASEPEREPAGWAIVAFASDAPDLVADATVAGRQVYRRRIAIRVGRTQGIDLVASEGTTLVSRADNNALQGGNADSSAPAVDATGNVVAFSSHATDLLLPFTDGNGPQASDVFVRNMSGNTTLLLSRARVGGGRGGDGDSSGVAVSGNGQVAAFASDATDLIAGDGNGARDVFYTRLQAPSPIRASVTSTGGEAIGSTATAASVWHQADTDEVWVAFESTAGNLDPTAPPAMAPSAYLYRSQGSPVTLRLGRPSAAATRQPSISPDGRRVVFLSAAADLDALRADGNALDDVFSFNLEAYRRPEAPIGYQRHSVAFTGRDADGASADARVAGFLTPGREFQNDLLLGFSTQAHNLGRSPNTDLVLQFLIDRTTPRTVALFSGTPRQRRVPFTAQFTDRSTNALTWEWTFGDGERSTERNPMHQYRVPGNYTVTLTVTGPGGTSVREEPGYIVATAQARTWSQIYRDGGVAGLNQGAICASCHPSRARILGDESGLYALLVNQPSFHCVGRLRVEPGNAMASQFLEMLDPLSTTRCFAHEARANPELHAALTEWIEGGANR